MGSNESQPDGRFRSQWDPMNPNLMGAFVLNGTYR